MTMNKRISILAFFVYLLTIGFAANASAQTADEQEAVKLKATLVNVPVIVSDREGRYLSGLRAADFTLYNDLGDRMRNVVIITMTEFGRTIRQNGSGGTDHGHASVAFTLGGAVKGGKVYGKWPGLASEQLYEGRDLQLTTDFRDVFAEIAARHMGATNLGAIFPGFTPNPANFKGLIRG